jgi:LPS-assembly protein
VKQRENEGDRGKISVMPKLNLMRIVKNIILVIIISWFPFSAALSFSRSGKDKKGDNSSGAGASKENKNLPAPVLGGSGVQAVKPATIDGDEINYLRQEGKVSVKGHVLIDYKNVKLSCDEAVYDVNDNIARLDGKVIVIKEGTIIYGEHIVYDLDAEKAEFDQVRFQSQSENKSGTGAARTGEAPPTTITIFGKAKDGVKPPEKEEYIFRRGYFTTCDRDEPHYRFAAKRIIVYPNERIILKNVIFKVGKLPLFYLPYLAQSLKRKEFVFTIRPGKDKDLGNYVLSSTRYYLNENQRGHLFLDYYEKRGWAEGVSHKIESKDYGESLFNYYTLRDKMYRLASRESLLEKYPERAALDAKYLENDRYKAQYYYQGHPTSALSINAEFNKFSDEFFMKDFFYREYEKNMTPPSYALINYSFTHSSLSLLEQKRVNNFFSETQYLPQVEYNLFSQGLGKTGLYFQSDIKAADIQRVQSRSSVKDGVDRVHSYSSFNYPTNIKWLYLNPHTGYYFTYYSRDIYERYRLRGAPEFGIDMSTKLYRPFNAGFNLFGKKIEKMRHIITPTINYNYIHPPTSPVYNITQFDGVDSLSRSESVVLTLDNKLQAKSGEEKWDLLYFSPAATYQIGQKSRAEKTHDYLSTVTGKLEMYPVRYISLNTDTTYDGPLRRTSSVNTDLSLSSPANPNNSISIGNRYVRLSSALGTYGVSYDLTSKIHFSGYMRCEYLTGDIQEQQYNLRFDLHCWWFDLGFDVKRRSPDPSKNEIKDYGVTAVFTLKAFPQLFGGFQRGYSGAKRAY